MNGSRAWNSTGGILTNTDGVRGILTNTDGVRGILTNADGVRGIPLNVTLHGWPVPPPAPETEARIPEVDARPNGTNRNFNFNATGFVALDEDMIDPGFTDTQTLIMAAVGTLLTLVMVVGVVLAMRLLWQRYQGGKAEDYKGVLQRDDSSEPGRQGVAELKTSESMFTAATSEEQTSPTVLTPKSNGSVITMTLKNNHLIVETEETTCTSPSVRVDSRGSTTTYVTTNTMDCPTEGHGSHGAMVHRPPEEEEKPGSLTGLSQSDLSMSSNGSQNTSYRYGDQSAYGSAGFGYDAPPKVPPKPTCTASFQELDKYVHSHAQMDRADSVVSASDVNVFLRSDISAMNAEIERRSEGEGAESSESMNSSPNPPRSQETKKIEETQSKKEDTAVS